MKVKTPAARGKPRTKAARVVHERRTRTADGPGDAEVLARFMTGFPQEKRETRIKIGPRGGRIVTIPPPASRGNRRPPPSSAERDIWVNIFACRLALPKV